MEIESKTVEYEGKTYTITFESFGYGDSRFCVNGVSTNWTIANNRLTHISSFKETARRAIQDYLAKQRAEEAFKQWDGKL